MEKIMAIPREEIMERRETIEEIISKHTGKIRTAKTLEDLAIADTEIYQKLNTLFSLHVVNQRRELLISFCDWWDKNYFKNDDSITEEDLAITADEVDEFLADLNGKNITRKNIKERK